MLQRNNSRHAHIAHAAVVGLHAICCGLPALAMLAAALSGAASVGTLLPDSFEQFHRALHGYELWIVGVSATLVTFGAWLEWRQPATTWDSSRVKTLSNGCNRRLLSDN